MKFTYSVSRGARLGLAGLFLPFSAVHLLHAVVSPTLMPSPVLVYFSLLTAFSLSPCYRVPSFSLVLLLSKARPHSNRQLQSPRSIFQGIMQPALPDHLPGHHHCAGTSAGRGIRAGIYGTGIVQAGNICWQGIRAGIVGIEIVRAGDFCRLGICEGIFGIEIVRAGNFCG